MPSFPIKKFPRPKFFVSASICISFWSCLSYAGIGTTALVLSPTLLDVDAFLGIGLAEMAAILLVRTAGTAIGSMTTGVLTDKYPAKMTLWITTISALILAFTTAVQPLSNLWEIFTINMIIQGAAMGSLSNGVHAVMLFFWKTVSIGLSMQMIHFFFALGAFFIQITSSPFLSEDHNSCHLRSKCHIPANYCTSGEGSGLYNESSNICNRKPSTSFQYVFFISVIPLVLALPGLLFYSYKEECCIKSSICMKRDVDEILKEEEAIQNQEVEETKEVPSQSYPDSIPYIITIVGLSALFIFLDIGLEVTVGTYLFTYAVEGKAHFAKYTATFLSSLYWGTFACVRLVSIVLSWLNVHPGLLLIGNLTGVLISTVIMLIWRTSKIALWLSTGLMGSSFSSVFPNTLIWLGRNGPLNGKSVGFITMCALTGDLLLSTSVAVLMDLVGPSSFLYFNITAAILAACVLALMFLVSQVCKVKNSAKKEYELMETQKYQTNGDSNGSNGSNGSHY
jgi:FHS family Na+ dependent glucose MFS transporter 1